MRLVDEVLFTTDDIVDETLTLLRVKGLSVRAEAFGRRIFDERSIPVAKVSEADLARAWQVFRTFGDKGWSFTDCTSLAIIERLAIVKAFPFDQHFQQFRLVEVLRDSKPRST